MLRFLKIGRRATSKDQSPVSHQIHNISFQIEEGSQRMPPLSHHAYTMTYGYDHQRVISKVDLPLPQVKSMKDLPKGAVPSVPGCSLAMAPLMSLPSTMDDHFLVCWSLKARVYRVLVPDTLTTTAPTTSCSQLQGTTLAKSKSDGLMVFPLNPSRTLPLVTWKSTISRFLSVRLVTLMGCTPQLFSMFPCAMKELQQQYLTLLWCVKVLVGQTLEEVEISIRRYYIFPNNRSIYSPDFQRPSDTVPAVRRLLPAHPHPHVLSPHLQLPPAFVESMLGYFILFALQHCRHRQQVGCVGRGWEKHKIQRMTEKPKRVFHLKKRPNSKQGTGSELQKMSKAGGLEPLPEVSNIQVQMTDNIGPTAPEEYTSFTKGPQIFLESAQVKFSTLVGKVTTQLVRATNKGSTSIYYQWIKIPKSKANPNAVLDETPKFSCLNGKNTINPGQEIVFPFSFFSQIPGYFSEEYEFKCQPEPIDVLPLVKLQGHAYVVDVFQETRGRLTSDLEGEYIRKCVQEILMDLLDDMKSPEEPPADLSQPHIAQREFEKVNHRLGVFYNLRIFSWWLELSKDVQTHLGTSSSSLTWDLDITKLRKSISQISEQDSKEYLLYRFNNYLHLSQKPDLNRSPLYKDIYNMIEDVAGNIAADFNDSVRKELQMWEVSWKAPEQEENPAERKAREDEVAKIKAEWLKKAKKKKWTDEDEKNLVLEYHNKLSSKVKEQILGHYDNYESSSRYVRSKQLLEKPPLSSRYFRFLERLKNIRECDIQNKKVLLKVELLGHHDSEQRIQEYQEYLEKKRQVEKRREEEKKEAEKNKDKKKKPKTTDEPDIGDFSITQIVNQDSLNQLVQIIRYIQQKSVKLLTILITFGPKSPGPNSLYSLNFLFDHLKSLDSSLLFVKHSELEQVGQKVEDDVYSDGTVILVENCNFFSGETGRVEREGKVDELFAEEIVDEVKVLRPFVDIYVNDNKQEDWSGITSFIDAPAVLGISWWNNIGICLKAEGSTMVIGGKLTPEKIELVERMMWYTKEIFLVGELGFSFMMAKQNVPQYLNFALSDEEIKAIQRIDHKINQEWQPEIPVHKRTPIPPRATITIPIDLVIGKKQTDLTSPDNIKIVTDLTEHQQDFSDHLVLDIGEATINHILTTFSNPERLFILSEIHLDNRYFKSSQIVYKELYKLKEARKKRHEEEEKRGINYKADVVVVVVNDLTFLNENLQLVEKKKRAVRKEPVEEGEEEGQEYEEEDQEQEEEQEEGNQKKVINIPDFYLKSEDYPVRLLSGKFNKALSKIERLPRSELD